MQIDLKPNEMVVKAGNSDRLENGSKIDGKFIVTNQRIYFKGLNGNAGKYDLEIMPSDIREVHFVNTGFLSPNGLNLILKGGQEFRFRVKQRNSFGELINSMY
ncbi:MAG: hypothetical protein EA408_05985 [Marinilabiliales bacterium]|nr:MAG: hypothetical protein EA408_05985 [Marinilabiliales bacterium]